MPGLPHLKLPIFIGEGDVKPHPSVARWIAAVKDGEWDGPRC